VRRGAIGIATGDSIRDFRACREEPPSLQSGEPRLPGQYLSYESWSNKEENQDSNKGKAEIMQLNMITGFLYDPAGSPPCRFTRVWTSSRVANGKVRHVPGRMAIPLVPQI